MNSENMQSAVAEEVNKRMAKAAAEIQDRYESGRGGFDYSADGPTGAAYKEKDAQAKKKLKEKKAVTAEAPSDNIREDVDSDEDDDDDPELRKIRESRMKQLKDAHKMKLENAAKGHGQYREIVQDEFISEVTSSQIVICHFYHRDFPRCEVMHHHLNKLAQHHIETKFVKINADKALFFVDKLKIRSIPTVVIFFDGVAGDKIIGFEGLSDKMPEGKEDEWPTVALARLLASKGGINKATIVDEEEVQVQSKAKMEEMRRNVFVNGVDNDMDEDLDELLADD